MSLSIRLLELRAGCGVSSSRAVWRCCGGCGQSVLEMFMINPASFTHLLLHTSLKAHTRLQTKPIKKRRAAGNWCRADSFEEHVCRVLYQQSAPHTHTSVLFFWNMMFNSCIMNHLLSLNKMKPNTLKCFFANTSDLESLLVKFYLNV